MAQFKLFIKEKNNLIPLTIFDSNQDSVLTFATYDEQFTINNYGQFSLTFNMARYVHVGNEKIENLTAHNIKHGTLIQLVDRYQDVYIGVVTNISYTFSSDNIVMNFTVADQFSTELSKRNIGYSLNDNIDAADYIGAMTLDAWARRIISDCKITWFYIDVDAFTNDIRRLANQPSYNDIKSFSVSNSNAFDALKSLAEFYGMDIKVNSKLHSFAFTPLKNPLDKGFRLSPLLDLSSFSLSTDSQSMLTIMNVKGVEMPNGDYLTLLSSIPPSILSWFNTDDWKNSIFYANMFQDYLEYNSTELSETERNFLATVYYTPTLENKLINIDYYMENQFLTEQERNELYDLLYNDLRIANGTLIYYQSQLQQALTHSKTLWNNFLINSENVHAALEAGLTQYIDNEDKDWEETFANYIENYNSVFSNTFNPSSDIIYNRDSYITQSFNRYNNAYQNFLEAIYNWRAYWNAPVSDTDLTSNGEYYCDNIDETDNEVVIQCAQIATALSGYWERAVTEGKYAGFWLPKTWDVVKLLPELSGRKAGYAPLSISGGVISINSNVVPSPTLAQSTSSSWHDVNWLYSTETPEDDSYHLVNDTIHNADVFVPKYIQDDSAHWYFQIKTGFQKVYYELNIGSNFTYKNILNGISTSTNLPKEWVEGLAGNQLKYAAQLADWPIPGYKTALTNRDAIWLELYQKYSNVIIENYYEDTTATTAELLLENARTKFELLSRPEPTYNLAMIDIYNLNNAGLNKVEITDKILLDSKVIEDKPGELQQLLNEQLYVSSISYNLRSDAEINLTVNPVRYDDVLLKRFVKLL